ncbi:MULTISPECIES: glycosyltransferase [Streptomyces]|uniref:Glycosyltransferase n=1 Tax=Streptomyces solicathayae TaxID=3081768 RepID=A0ABZ0LYT8_9ACTN|nr:glycosyltransferase [Streptomyces sp. HUAS YS2]WOX24684.1 glycosyltransferase [Streptomyces sp. HUAS YS2]
MTQHQMRSRHVFRHGTAAQARSNTDKAAGLVGPAAGAPTARVRLPGTVLCAVLVVLSGAADLLVHTVSCRLLGPADYGTVASLLSLVAALGVPLAAVQTVLAATVVRARERGQAVRPQQLLRRVLILATVLAAVSAPLAWPLGAALRIPVLPLLLADLFLIPSAACAVLWAWAYGSHGLAAVVLPTAAGASVRLAATVLFLHGGHGALGVVAATVLGETVTAVSLLIASRVLGRRAPHSRTVVLRLAPRVATTAVTTMTGLWVLTGIDVVFARRWLPAEESGRYAAAAFLAKALVCAAQVILLFLLDRLASQDAAASGRALGMALAAAGLAGTVATGALTLGGHSLVPLMFGDAYRIGALLGLCLGVAVTLLVALTVLLHYHATNGSAMSGGWTGALAFAVLLLLLPRTPEGVAAALAVAAGLSVARALYDVPRTRRGRHPAAVVPSLPNGTNGPNGPAERAGGGLLHRAADLDVSIVIPYYNPGPALRRHVEDVLRVLDGYGLPYEVVAVSDGCTDGSPRLLDDVTHHRLVRVGYPVNGGKGTAVRTGFSHSRGRWIGFIDADGDVPADLLPTLLDVARIQGADAAIGAKTAQPAALSHRSEIARWVCSHTYRRVTRLLFHLPVHDTQTGIKVFRREALASILPLCREPRFAFDLELLALLQRHGFRRFAVVPVRLRTRFTSTVSFMAVLLMLIDTVQLSLRVSRTRPLLRRPGLPRPTTTAIGPQPVLRTVPETQG